MSKFENAADGSWANLNLNQAVNLKNASPFKALKFSACPIILRLFLVNRHLGKKVSNAWTNFVLKKKDLEVRGSSLARRVVSQDKELHSTLALFTPVCKRVLATYCWEVTLPWTSFNYLPAGAILLGMFHVKETGISSGRLDLSLVCALTFTLTYISFNNKSLINFALCSFHYFTLWN